MKLLIKKLQDQEDEDATVTELYVDGIQKLRGDWYHDKIDDQIQAYVQCLKDLGHEFELEEEIINI